MFLDRNIYDLILLNAKLVIKILILQNIVHLFYAC